MLDGFHLSQVVIVPILKKNTDTEAVLKAADDLAVAASSAGIRAKVDAGTEKTPGFKFSFWEMKVCCHVRRPPIMGNECAMQCMQDTHHLALLW